MSNIFVPIDSSNLSELIPEGDDILYSEYCNVQSRGSAIVLKWKSHVLATKSGFAAFTRIEPSKDKGKYILYKERKKKEGMIAQFIPWEDFGTDINKPSFAKNHVKVILNKDSSLFRHKIYVWYKDPNSRGFGHFCRDLWFDKVMK